MGEEMLVARHVPTIVPDNPNQFSQEPDGPLGTLTEGTMSEPRKGIPEGASAVIPRLFCRDPLAELEFCVAAFGATESVRRPGTDGKIAHAVVLFGPAMVMIESEWPQATNRAPALDGSSSVA